MRVISYDELEAKEGFRVQKRMNFGVKGSYSILVFSFILTFFCVEVFAEGRIFPGAIELRMQCQLESHRYLYQVKEEIREHIASSRDLNFEKPVMVSITSKVTPEGDLKLFISDALPDVPSVWITYANEEEDRYLFRTEAAANIMARNDVTAALITLNRYTGDLQVVRLDNKGQMYIRTDSNGRIREANVRWSYQCENVQKKF